MGSPRPEHSGCGRSPMAGQGSSCASSWPSDPFCRSSWVLWASFLWHPVLLLISGCLSICWIELWLQRELDFHFLIRCVFGTLLGLILEVFWEPKWRPRPSKSHFKKNIKNMMPKMSPNWSQRDPQMASFGDPPTYLELRTPPGSHQGALLKASPEEL